MTNTLIHGMKNAKLKKLVKIMTLSVILLMMGTGIASAHSGDSQETFEPAQSKTRITGTVVDQTGEPVIGANVVEKGATANGTISDADGKFSLNISPEATLIVSYIGYMTQEIAVGNRTDLRIVLAEDLLNLEEVVVIGYGSARKKDVTGSVVRADISKLRESPNVSLGQSLQGTVPGLNVGAVTQAGTDPNI
jgi:hypothetical protein